MTEAVTDLRCKAFHRGGGRGIVHGDDLSASRGRGSLAVERVGPSYGSKAVSESVRLKVPEGTKQLELGRPEVLEMHHRDPARQRTVPVEFEKRSSQGRSPSGLRIHAVAFLRRVRRKVVELAPATV